MERYEAAGVKCKLPFETLYNGDTSSCLYFHFSSHWCSLKSYKKKRTEQAATWKGKKKIKLVRNINKMFIIKINILFPLKKLRDENRLLITQLNGIFEKSWKKFNVQVSCKQTSFTISSGTNFKVKGEGRVQRHCKLWTHFS